MDRLRRSRRSTDLRRGEVAIAWTLRHPAVTGAIVGARNAAQVEGTIGGAKLKLMADDLALLEGK